jgi:tRNA 2-thiouridine synthesizing protein A
MDQNSRKLKPDRTLDVIGFFCPEPIFRTRMEIDQMKRGEVLEVLADDPAAKADITAWAHHTGQMILTFEKNGDVFRFLIRKK